ncbi:hypothetical protein DENIS_4828 [Desulfonema ishimotonii]|uniref:Uncharacterized protein n=1 Tax=Desulfonema ishimotonii TaxID=45657 RepID=A0A401G3L4_9BACT|nr:tetratricopeptide repeat protein [Desulfonema ishimotonii]GBC63829.1 hypothetical protein DENIS_4828 [Desulfonema ishimotonii]
MTSKRSNKKAKKAAKRKVQTRKQKHLQAEQRSRFLIEDVVDEAMQRIEEGDFRTAERILSKLKKKHGGNPLIFYGLGVLEAFKENFSRAIGYFNSATDLRPDLVEAHFNKAVAYQQDADISNAIRAFQKVVEYGEPDNDLVEAAQDKLDIYGKTMKEMYNLTIETFTEAQDLFEAGFALMDNREWEKAIGKFQQAIEKNPHFSQPYGNMGMCYGFLGEKQKSLDALDRALEIDPGYEPAIFNRMAVEALEEGQKLNVPMKEIRYKGVS